jgi:tRNA modification GTPase
MKMDKRMLGDTIIAVSTPRGCGGLGIIRLSGKRARALALRIFRPKAGIEKKIPPRRSIIGKLFNFEKREEFDEAILTYFPAPNSYTREDVVEITCHGSPVIMDEAIRLGIAAGARHARPGEFTLRAYLRGRIDILQAEAVDDLIRAASLKQARISYRQLEGSLSRMIGGLRGEIVRLVAQVEASLEFPDEKLRITASRIKKKMEGTISSVRKLIASYAVGRSLREGIILAIAGRTNVGKSTLFNALLERKRAIVTPYPGTTRDYLRETVVVHDSIFHLVDMAGLGRASHPVEKEGIRRGRKIASQADGLLLVLDASRRESQEDLRLLAKYRGKRSIVIFNKIDLPKVINEERILSLAKNTPLIRISALNSTNLGLLRNLIFKTFLPEKEDHDEVILHAGQKIVLEEALRHLLFARKLLEQGYPEDVYVEELRKVVTVLGEMTGEIQAQEVIETIFRRFCVGK